MFARSTLRTIGFTCAASLLAACSAGTLGSQTSPSLAGGDRAVGNAEAVAIPGSTTARAEFGPTGLGKTPQRFARGLHVSRAHAPSVACTTVSPSADVLSALSEPGSTATAAYVIDAPNGSYAKQDFDGSECDIAVYVSPAASGTIVTDSTIHDGIRGGLVVDGASGVRVVGNALYNVGDHNGTLYTPDGVQYGFALMFENGGGGEVIANNSVYDYQKDGILAFDAVSLAVTQNDVTGAGAVAYIASNGIEMDGVAFTAFSGNRVSLNQYTGQTYGAAGYLACGDTLGGKPITHAKIKSNRNFAEFNDIEIYVSSHPNCS